MHKALIVGTALLVLGCDQLVEPEFISPELKELQMRQFPFRFQGEWSIRLQAGLANADVRPQDNARVRIHFQTGSGDIEEIALRPEFCGDVEHAYSCATFNLKMDPGRHINDLRPRLHEIPARFATVDNDGSRGSMWILEGELEPAMKRARSWPGVASTDVSVVIITDWQGTPTFPKTMAAVALVSFGTPVLGDGIIQAGAGDSLIATYTQPDGQVLEISSVMCEQPQGTGFGAGLGDIPPCG
jgi:hypothetical protein